MQISSQLAAAGSHPISRTAISVPTDSTPTFHEAFRSAATRGETAGKPVAASSLASEISSAANARTDGGTAAAESGVAAGGSASLLPGLSGEVSLPAVDKGAAAAETAAPGIQTIRVQGSAARAGESKSKKTPASDESAGASATALNSAPLAVSSILQPRPAPVISNDTLASDADSSTLPFDSTNSALPSPASQGPVEVAGPVQAPADEQSTAIAAPALLTTMLPGSLPEGLPANASRIANEAAQPLVKANGAANAEDGPGTGKHPRSSAEAANSSAGATASSITDGLGMSATQLTSLGGAQSGMPQNGALSPVAPVLAGANRSGAGEVRGKRKETAADVSSLERDATPAAPAPFAARLAEAQAPTQTGANDPSNVDPAALQKALDQSQSLVAASTPAAAETASPTPAAHAASSVPVTSADTAAEPAAIPGASSAQLIQSAGQTEMRLGMHSAEFGNISISTSVSHQAISAQISLDHSELGRALAVHLPAIEEKLGAAYGLHARVEVRDGSASAQTAPSGQHGQGGQEQAGRAGSGQGRSGFTPSPMKEATAIGMGLASTAANDLSLGTLAAGTRLDIRV